ncbi:MAG TPA: cytochrome b561 domain-containing protein [Bauldia sp.]|nr:cytochrome b561 domain-containing protein [Bauldia sp.]
MDHQIPHEVYIGLLGRSIAVHWDLHALLMVFCWAVLVPAAIVIIRYGKPAPRPTGIPHQTTKYDRDLVWFTLHVYLLNAAIVLTLLGAAIAITVNGGFSGSVHSYFGVATVIFGVLQIVSASQRGKHGGPNHPGTDLNDPSTWPGDHFAMTSRRRWFEAYHKTSGYFALFCAAGAIATGLAQFWLPVIAILVAIVLPGWWILSVLFERAGLHHDTYGSVFGTKPDYPYNRERAGQ